MKNPIKVFDSFFISIINDKMSNRYTKKLFYYLTNLGGVPCQVGIVLLSFLVGGVWRIFSIDLVTSLAISTAIVQVLKRVFSRSRPYWILDYINTYGLELRDFSFPSGHSAAIFTVAIIYVLNNLPFARFVVVIAVLVAISRVYLGVHYPSDVVVGSLIGGLSAYFAHSRVFPMVLEYIENNMGGIL